MNTCNTAFHKIYTGIFLFLCLSFCTSGSAAGANTAEKKNLQLSDPGTENIVQYEKYGSYSGTGTYQFKYTIKNKNGLAQASGEGIDPNRNVLNDPEYKKYKDAGRIKSSYWNHVGTEDPAADFYAWATAFSEDPGVRLFFTGKALENAGLYLQAIKAYRAVMILYPNSFCWNAAHSWTWLTAPAAWNSIINLTRMHPELELKLNGSMIKTETMINGDPVNNKVAVTPGQFITFTSEDRKKAMSDITSLKVIEQRCKKISCVKYANKQWGLQINGKPFIVKGVSYSPTRVGYNYDWNWMESDINKNKTNDAAYETWVDSNRNNRQDKNEKKEGDFALLNEMGCNVIRIFNTLALNKPLLREMYKKYQIRVVLCDPLGAYTVHSGADWASGTDYSNKEQREAMKEYVKQTVLECRNEEWLLAYILGNENNMPADFMGVNASRTRAGSQPQAYAEFLNEVAGMIHKLDPDHPVGVGNMSLGLIDYYARYAPEIDFIGINEYSGSYGFGALWERAARMIDRPVLITEYGCDAYATGIGPDEDAQAYYHYNAWQDIVYNSAGNPGAGNSIGGIAFEWLDEWWKDTRGDSPESQNIEPTFDMDFPDGFSQEEWLGLAGQGNGSKSPFLRQPRKVYYQYRELWNTGSK